MTKIPNSLSQPGMFDHGSVVSRNNEGKVVNLRHWKWRDRHGNFVHPTDMDTKHMFNVLKMIWNHRMPEGAHIHPFRAYTFPPVYTDEYLACAIRAMAMELHSRDDMLKIQHNQLQFMINWLRTNQLESPHER